MGVKRIDAERAKELLEEEEDFTFLDVRTPEEYQLGHIPGAKNIPFMIRGPHGAGLHLNSEFVSHVKTEFGVESKLILGCQKGGRSNKACQVLAEEGYTNLHDMRGGFLGETDPFGNITFPGWTTRGFPVAEV